MHSATTLLHDTGSRASHSPAGVFRILTFHAILPSGVKSAFIMLRKRFLFQSVGAIILGLVLASGSGQVMAQRPLGVDVSNHQGSGINWASVKSAGYTFAWAKATEGLNFTDADFPINEANAKSAGVLIGAYHFAHPDVNPGTAGADAEAAYFWNVAKNYIQSGGGYLVPMLDAEVASPGAQSAVSIWINQWCQDMVNYGTANGIAIKPVVYTYQSWASSYCNSTVTQWPLWMASPNGQNPQTGAPNGTTPWPTWALWQYGQATVSGVSGAVDVDVFNGTGASFSSAFVITNINNPPSITTQPVNTTVTLGSNATFTVAVTGTPVPTLQWKFNNTNIASATGTSYTIFNAQTTNAGTYSLVASNSLGTATSSNATLTVFIPLTITAQPTNLTVILGSNATFNVAAIGTPAPTYQWQFNNVNIPTATSSSLALVNVQSNKQGSYSVSVSNSTGSIISSNAILTVVTRPAITTQPFNATVNQGGATNFTVTASGTPTLSYQWQLGGSNIAGATASTYVINNAQPAQAGNYQVVVTNNYGTVTSAVRTLTVIAPPFISGQPQSQTVTVGSNATFTVTATGTSLTYQWLFNTGVIGGATGTSYTVMNAQTNNAGNYSVLVTNSIGSMTSSNAVLTVNAMVQPPQFQSITVLSNGVVQMVLSGQTGSSYEIDGSSNLVNWIPVTNFVNTNGTYQFTDMSSTNNPFGFYRAKLLP
jgi:GH25 family lysozyme M1 (1,4-beta-N-acetylmuramidase)